jgi:hypothetical protein
MSQFNSICRDDETRVLERLGPEFGKEKGAAEKKKPFELIQKMKLDLNKIM